MIHEQFWAPSKSTPAMYFGYSGVTPMGSGCANPRAPELRGHPKGAPSAWVPIKIPWNSIQRQKMCPFKLQDFRNWWNQTYSGAPRTKSVFCNGSVPIEPNPYSRSFSKLKLIKTYLRSSIAQDRLDALAIISVEIEQSRNLNIDELIDQFAERKARQNIFKV